MNNMNKVVDYINQVFKNDNIRMFTIMITGVFAGYTLEYVPIRLNDLFQKSNLFKFLILLLIGVSNFYPVTKDKLLKIVVISILILFIFALIRRYY